MDQDTDRSTYHNTDRSAGHAADQSIDRLRESKDLLEMMIRYRTTCDDKASIIIAVFGVMVSVLLMAGGTETIQMIRSLAGSSDVLSFLIIAAMISSAVLLITGFFYLVITVIPKMDVEELKEEEKDGLNLEAGLYFKNIDVMRYKKFSTQFNDREHEEYLNDVLSEVYITAKACTRKYHSFKLGVIIGGLGILLLLVAMVAGFMYAV